MKAYAKWLIERLLWPAIYWTACLRTRVSPKRVLFASCDGDELPREMKPLYERCKAAGYEVLTVCWRQASMGALQNLRRFASALRLFAGAGTIVCCDFFWPLALPRKRRETRVVQLWHACGAYKKFGYDRATPEPYYRISHPFAACDLVTVSAPWCVPYFESALRLPPGVCQPLGICRTDRYFEPDFEARCREKLLRLLPEAAGKKLVVVALTFHSFAPFNESAASDWSDALSLGDEWFVLTHAHPMLRNGASSFEIDELLQLADVLVSDYSSVVFEYARFDRPLVLYTPDLAEYERTTGLYITPDEIPARKATTLPQLREEIQRADMLFDGEAMAAFARKTLAACDGHATDRVFRWLESHTKQA